MLSEPNLGVKAPFSLMALGLALSACSTTVEMQYQTNPPSNDYASVAKRASDHFEYVELSRMYIRVAPQDIAAPANQQDGSPSTKPQADATATQDKAGAGAGKSRKKGKAPAKAAAPSNGGTVTPQQPAGTGSANSTGSDEKAATSDPDAVLKTTLIDGKKWTAAVVPISDDNYGFWVRGVTSYWTTTAISIARYENSDMVSSVSSKAENLVAKRLGQFAGAGAAMVKILGAAGIGVDSAGIEPEAPLLPFSIAVPESGKDIGDLNDGWSYSFEYDSDKPVAGAIGFDSFMSGVANTKIAYWPVLACRTAVLTLFPPNNKGIGHNFAFNIVVSHPNVLRLQPVPVDGKLAIGAICGASETGTQSADPTQALVDSLSALQQGIQKVSDAKNKKGDTTSPSPASGSSTKSESKP
jgi:hypothetical protein